MSDRNTFIFECRPGGLLFWNKNSGSAMFPIFCPYSGETCRILCPFLTASDEGQLTFNCGPHVIQYRGDWKIDKDIEKKKSFAANTPCALHANAEQETDNA